MNFSEKKKGNRINHKAEMENGSIIIEQTLNAPVEKVWDAITNVGKMRIWYMQTIEDFKPEAGFRTKFIVQQDGIDYLHVWKITEVIPNKKISYEWRYVGYPGNTLVTFELFGDGNKTKLTLTHSGLDSFMPEKYPELSKEEFVEGWTNLIGTSLKEFVEQK